MTTTTTHRHGLTTIQTTTGYDLRSNRGQLVGRVQFRKNYAGKWCADCYAYDGFAWTLDRRTSPTGLPEARRIADTWTAAVGLHCWIASGNCHA